MKSLKIPVLIGFVFLACAAFAQIQIGETKLQGGGTFDVGYAGSYGDDIQSSHGLTFGFSNDVSGSYYNPNFLSFDTILYYNQSKADSNFQSLTDATGVAASVNLFTGSKFPGSVSYHYDHNSTGTNGLDGVPNFTTNGNGQGFAINWAVLFPDLPTLSVGYQHGSGSGTLYGTDAETSSSQNTFNLHSSYQIAGFRLNGYYDHTNLNSDFPQFLSGYTQTNDSSGQDMGVNTNRSIPFWRGSFYAGYNHSTYSNDYSGNPELGATSSSYSGNNESAGASFHPTQKLSFNIGQNYTDNLSAYLNQGLLGSGPTVTPVVDLGTGSYSNTMTGSLNYQFTNTLSGTATATQYRQSYLGQTYTGTFISGFVNYSRKLWDMFSFSAGIVDSTANFNGNTLGFVGNVNYFHRFGPWETSGALSYAQNVQSVLITETTSYFNYNANIHRRFSARVQWTAAFNGSHSGITDGQTGNNNNAGFTTSLSLRKVQLSANYLTGSGNSVYTANGLVPVPVVPGVTAADVIAYNAKSYGGGVSLTPLARLVLSGTYARALSDTRSYGTFSRNNTEIITGQMQYRLRRISIMAGYTRFSQGFTALGPTSAPVTSYYAGISRWFNFF